MNAPQKKVLGNISVAGGSTPLVYENCVFDGRGTGDTYLGQFVSRTGLIHFKNCIFRRNEGINKQCLFISDCSDFIIENCTFENCTLPIGVWQSLNITRAQIINCRFYNFSGNCIQFFQCKGGGIRINDNRFYQANSNAFSNDVINLYSFQGLVNDYAQVNRNWGKLEIPTARYTIDYTGAFVVLGDGDDFDNCYIDCQDNVSVDVTACGYQITQFGTTITRDIVFKNNRSYNQLRRDAIRGNSSLGLQFEALRENNVQLAGNAHYCIRARFQNENFDSQNDIYPPLSTTLSEAIGSPAWLTSNVLPSQIFL